MTTGARVVAVEPVAEMRAKLVGFDALDGTAEALPLEDASADVITVAQALHWFDLEHALPEFHRVLRPEGRLAILNYSYDGRAFVTPPGFTLELEAQPFTLWNGRAFVLTARAPG